MNYSTAFKFLSSLTLISTILISTVVKADVIIEIPKEIELLVANSERTKKGSHVFIAKNKISLPNGENQIAFRYEIIFDKNSGRDVVASDVILATFDSTDSQLKFELPKFYRLSEAESGVKSLNWKLKPENGSALNVHQDRLTVNGLQIGRNYVREVEDYNRKGDRAAVSGSKTAHEASSTLAKTGDNSAEEMLHFWFNKADKQTRKRFKDFVNKQ